MTSTNSSRIISSTEPSNDANFVERTSEIIKKTVDWTRRQLIIYSLDNRSLQVKLNSLESELIDLNYISSLYKVADLPINGFSAFVDLLLQFFRHLERTNYFASAKTADDLEIMVDLMIKDVKMLKLHHSDKTSDNGNSIKSLFTKDYDTMKVTLENHEYNSVSSNVMIENFSGFWNNDTTLNWLKLQQTITAYNFTSFPKCFKVFTNDKFKRKAAFDAFRSMYALRAMRVIDGHLARKLLRGVVNRDSRCNSKTFYIERQGRWTVSPDKQDVFESQPPILGKLPLRFRFYQNKRCKNTNGALIFYCHGGGFVTARPELHEAYLKKWVGDLENVPMLCLDYSLRVANPIVFQEFLDAYLWVTSNSPDVVDKIGFQPKKIIISGDSAGGILGMGLLSCLTLIETKDPTMLINFPSDLVYFYGAFIVAGHTSPSRLKMFYDELVTSGLLMLMLGCVTGAQGSVEPRPRPTQRLTRAFKYVWEDCLALKEMMISRTDQLWFMKDDQFDADKILETFKKLENSFFNSIEKLDYERLSKVRLFLMTSKRCCFLDDNVELAKAWKGPIELHTVNDAAHGFLLIPGEKDLFEFAENLLRKASSDP